MRFTKMQGVGNDFVVVEADALLPQSSLAALAVRACDRKFGIGADGLLVVSQGDPQAAFRMRMFNPDGTEDMCGNGLRCVSLWAHRAGWLGSQDNFAIATKEGMKQARLLEWDREERSALVGVDMGRPKFAPEDLPFCDRTRPDVVGYGLRVGDETYAITAVNTGSTHTVLFGDDSLDEATFQRVSPAIENHPLFPQRTSVLWATPTGDDGYSVRIWERGVGETLGCGTGACAVAVAAIREGRSRPGMPLDIVSPGGILRITWSGGDAPIDMVGPAQIVFQGEMPFDPAR